MGKLPYMKFFPGDWLKDPALQACSDSTRGIWINLVARMWETNPRGILHLTLPELTRIANTNRRNSNRFLLENELHKFADISNDNGTLTVTCRRIIRDEKEREYERKKKEKQRMGPDCPEDVPPVVPGLSRECPLPSSYSGTDTDSEDTKKEKSKPKKKQGLPEYSTAFSAAMKEYPKRKGNPAYPEAFERWKKLISNNDIDEVMLIRACRNYRLEQESIDNAGTEYVMQMSKFFGPGKHFATYIADDYQPPEPRQTSSHRLPPPPPA